MNDETAPKPPLPIFDMNARVDRPQVTWPPMLLRAQADDLERAVDEEVAKRK